jgi:hypothetical protein
MKHRALIPIESCLEGVNRRNLKFIYLSTHYKRGLVLELKLKFEREGKQINQQIRRVDTVICFTEVRF